MAKAQEGPRTVAAAGRTLEAAQTIQRLADARGGPQTKLAAQHLTEAASNCVRVASVDTGRSFALAMEQMAIASRAWEQACRVDGLPEWLPSAQAMAQTTGAGAKNLLRSTKWMKPQAIPVQPEPAPDPAPTPPTVELRARAQEAHARAIRAQRASSAAPTPAVSATTPINPDEELSPEELATLVTEYKAMKKKMEHTRRRCAICRPTRSNRPLTREEVRHALIHVRAQRLRSISLCLGALVLWHCCSASSRRWLRCVSSAL
jgi:hypothetical protein